MSDTDVNPPRTRESIWMRILTVIILLVLFGLAEMVLWVLAVLQLIWLPMTGAPNRRVAELGAQLASWTAKAVSYLTGASETRPFPWDDRHTGAGV